MKRSMLEVKRRARWRVGVGDRERFDLLRIQIAQGGFSHTTDKHIVCSCIIGNRAEGFGVATV